jgi:hypothetical protein
MHTSFDQTLPQASRWDQQAREYVRSSIDWCARCSKRLVGLKPALCGRARASTWRTS